MSTEPGNAEKRLSLGVRRCLAREPTANELQLLAAALTREREALTQNPAAVATICGGQGDVDQAAFVMIANVLLNLDETMTRE